MSDNYPHRLLCTVLDEMRKCYETRNFSYLLGLIEEAQTLGNRMEAGLEYTADIEKLHSDRKALSKSVETLKEDIKKLRKEKEALKEDIEKLTGVTESKATAYYSK